MALLGTAFSVALILAACTDLTRSQACKTAPKCWCLQQQAALLCRHATQLPSGVREPSRGRYKVADLSLNYLNPKKIQRFLDGFKNITELDLTDSYATRYCQAVSEMVRKAKILVFRTHCPVLDKKKKKKTTSTTTRTTTTTTLKKETVVSAPIPTSATSALNETTRNESEEDDMSQYTDEAMDGVDTAVPATLAVRPETDGERLETRVTTVVTSSSSSVTTVTTTEEPADPSDDSDDEKKKKAGEEGEDRDEEHRETVRLRIALKSLGVVMGAVLAVTVIFAVYRYRRYTACRVCSECFQAVYIVTSRLLNFQC